MKATIIDTRGVTASWPSEESGTRLPTAGFFWLDVASASDDEIAALASALQLDHTLATWLPRFGQSARFDASQHGARISTWADAGSRGVVEGHILFSRSWLITLFDGAVSRTDEARSRFRDLAGMIASQPYYALIIVLNELVTGFYPRLERADEVLDQLEERIFLNPNAKQLLSLADLRKELSSMHRLLVPLRDTVKTQVTSVGGIPGIGAEVPPSFQTYSERLVDLVDLIDDYRQRTTEAMEGYAASVSNRQSEQINRLTVISWVFLPITFLTGYFGMNFNWAINGFLATRDAFFLFGIGLPLLSLAVTVLWFKSLGWMGAWRRKKLQSAAVDHLGPEASGKDRAGRTRAVPAEEQPSRDTLRGSAK